MQKNPEAQQFGEHQVTASEKTNKVHGVFDSVAPKYDIMNDLMSGGIHRLWKDRFVNTIAPNTTDDILDVAGGTGDIAFRMHKARKKYAAPSKPITICDLTHHMLQEGRNRAINQGWITPFNWTTGNAEKLPFPDESFDIYTIAFGLRNVTHIDTALEEAFRVLKPGGRFYCLEFSHVKGPFLSKLYDSYSRHIIPRIGQMIAGDQESYQYLIESIRKFPSRDALCTRLKDAGFAKAKATALSQGIVAIHCAQKANIKSIT